MFRPTSNFDKLLDKATSHVLMEPEWATIIQICDLIRQKDIQPKAALNALKPKLFSSNQYQSIYALNVLESMVKNCGVHLHDELSTRPFCDTLHELAKTTTHEKVRTKLLELIQAWNVAFRKNPKHVALKDLMATMKSDGFKFPAYRESDAMFTADSAPEWADGEVCHRCRDTFTLMHRKHHCRACGQVFCQACSAKTATLPKYGIEKEVRVCDACYELCTKGGASGTLKPEKNDDELPAEYLKSTLAQQSQAPPPRKTEDEIREEEELQLALAISQSEAEAKEKEKFKLTSSFVKMDTVRSKSPDKEETNPELAKYLDRSYWEKLNNDENRPTSPSAPSYHQKHKNENGINLDQTPQNVDLDHFIKTLQSQVEIFINRMKSNSSRGRSIANDTSVQSLFFNITAMHSELFGYIKQHDDSRLHFERLQDKLTQVKDARAALDDLREEHRERLRREAEEAERQRQLQMAHKLDIMRKKKQEYLQYQRQLALQRIQEQEREMQVRQEQQKQQYLMGLMGQSFEVQQQQAQQPFYGYPMAGQGMQAQGMVFNPYSQYGMMAPPRFGPSMPQMGPQMGPPISQGSMGQPIQQGQIGQQIQQGQINQPMQQGQIGQQNQGQISQPIQQGQISQQIQQGQMGQQPIQQGQMGQQIQQGQIGPQMVQGQVGQQIPQGQKILQQMPQGQMIQQQLPQQQQMSQQQQLQQLNQQLSGQLQESTLPQQQLPPPPQQNDSVKTVTSELISFDD